MQKAVYEWMLLPFFLFTIYQGYLYFHAAQVEEALNMAVFEGQIEASVQGRYTEEIYQLMKDYLQSAHRYDPDSIEIEGTETLTTRGNYLTVKIQVPKPLLTVIPLFNVDGGRYYVVEKRIMSEYIP